MLTRRGGLRLGATVAVILTSVRTNGLAAPPDKACSLLTTADISAQLGAPGDGRESDLPAGRGSVGNEPTKMCTWTVGGGSLRLSFAHGADVDATRQTFRAKIQSTIDAIKANGWTVDQRAFGENAMCCRECRPTNVMIAAEPKKFFTEPHYDGFPAVLVRIAEVSVAEMRMLLEEGWRCMAPPALQTANAPTHATKKRQPRQR